MYEQGQALLIRNARRYLECIRSSVQTIVARSGISPTHATRTAQLRLSELARVGSVAAASLGVACFVGSTQLWLYPWPRAVLGNASTYMFLSSALLVVSLSLYNRADWAKNDERRSAAFRKLFAAFSFFLAVGFFANAASIFWTLGSCWSVKEDKLCVMDSTEFYSIPPKERHEMKMRMKYVFLPESWWRTEDARPDATTSN